MMEAAVVRNVGFWLNIETADRPRGFYKEAWLCLRFSPPLSLVGICVYFLFEVLLPVDLLWGRSEGPYVHNGKQNEE